MCTRNLGYMMLNDAYILICWFCFLGYFLGRNALCCYGRAKGYVTSKTNQKNCRWKWMGWTFCVNYYLEIMFSKFSNLDHLTSLNHSENCEINENLDNFFQFNSWDSRVNEIACFASYYISQSLAFEQILRLL